MLSMSARKRRHPVAFFVLPEADDLALRSGVIEGAHARDQEGETAVACSTVWKGSSMVTSVPVGTTCPIWNLAELP